MVAYGRQRIPGKIDAAAMTTDFGVAAQAMGPVRLWLLGDTSGTTAVDLMGNGNLTLTNGPVLSSGGPLGRYVEFDGSNDYATASAVSLTGEWSAVGLVRVDVQRETCVVWGTGGSPALSWILGITPTQIEGFVYNAGYFGFTATCSLADGNWHLVGVSRRAGANASNLYLDGSSIAAGTIAAQGVTPTTTVVGYKSTSASPYFDGGMCGVGIWNRALTSAEHLTLAQAAGLA